jgi:hypothetical protein
MVDRAPSFTSPLPRPTADVDFLVIESLRDLLHTARPAIRRDGKHGARVSTSRRVGSESACCKRRISIGKIEIVVAGARFRLIAGALSPSIAITNVGVSSRRQLRATAETGIPSPLPTLPQAERAGGAVGVAPSVRLDLGFAAGRFGCRYALICNGMQCVAAQCIGRAPKQESAAWDFPKFR